MQVLVTKLAEVREENARLKASAGESSVGLVIEGGALAQCLMEQNHEAFLELCKECKAVVCCRVSPMQKAQVGVRGLALIFSFIAKLALTG